MMFRSDEPLSYFKRLESRYSIGFSSRISKSQKDPRKRKLYTPKFLDPPQICSARFLVYANW